MGTKEADWSRDDVGQPRVRKGGGDGLLRLIDWQRTRDEADGG